MSVRGWSVFSVEFLRRQKMRNFPPFTRSRPFAFAPELLEFLAYVTRKRASAENFVEEITKIRRSTFVIFLMVKETSLRAHMTVSRWKWQLASDPVITTDTALSWKFVNKSFALLEFCLTMEYGRREGTKI